MNFSLDMESIDLTLVAFIHLENPHVEQVMTISPTSQKGRSSLQTIFDGLCKSKCKARFDNGIITVVTPKFCHPPSVFEQIACVIESEGLAIERRISSGEIVESFKLT